MEWTMLALLALATARATHLVADDKFPFGGIRHAMSMSRHFMLQWLAMGLSCTFCVSIWSGAAAAALAVQLGWADAVHGFFPFAVLWFAFSQAVVLIEGITFKLMD